MSQMLKQIIFFNDWSWKFFNRFWSKCFLSPSFKEEFVKNMSVNFSAICFSEMCESQEESQNLQNHRFYQPIIVLINKVKSQRKRCVSLCKRIILLQNQTRFVNKFWCHGIIMSINSKWKIQKHNSKSNIQATKYWHKRIWKILKIL